MGQEYSSLERTVEAHAAGCWCRKEEAEPAEIAAQMGRSTSTISRELARNGHPQRGYLAACAQRSSQSAPGAGGAGVRKVGPPDSTPRWVSSCATNSSVPCHPNRSQAGSSVCILKT
ncbi:MAG: helix-turn-helix domain-containing protein [Burkholderiales bacterium]|nr:helix-turn-helix domain-containing protein [Burkholderiales bacterium]